MDLLLVITVDGLVFASWIFLVSLGLTLIYGVLRILNIAHGSLYALGAYMAAWLVGQLFHQGDPAFLSYLLLLVGALTIGLCVGLLVERGLLRRMYGHGEVFLLLVTYALFLILEDAMKLIWGVNPYYTYRPYNLLGQVTVGGIIYPGYSFLVMGIAFLAGMGLWLFINKTRFGKAVVAVIQDSEISQAVGINVPRIYTVAFVIGAILAALGGAFTAPMISVVPGIAVNVIVLSFAVVIIGGLGSLKGAALGSLIVGIARGATVHLIPELQVFVIYLVMVLVLQARPQGLFGKVEVKRI